MITINSLSQWEEVKKSQSSLFSKRIVKRFIKRVSLQYEDLILYSRNDNTFVSAFSTRNDAQIQEQLKHIRQNHWSNDFDYEFFFIPENDIAKIVFVI